MNRKRIIELICKMDNEFYPEFKTSDYSEEELLFVFRLIELVEEELLQKQEPVAWRITPHDGLQTFMHNQISLPGYKNEPLYLHPAPKIPVGWKLVPIDPTEEMMNAWEEGY